MFKTKDCHSYHDYIDIHEYDFDGGHSIAHFQTCRMLEAMDYYNDAIQCVFNANVVFEYKDCTIPNNPLHPTDRLLGYREYVKGKDAYNFFDSVNDSKLFTNRYSDIIKGVN